MKFSDLRSIKKLQKCLENFKSNQKSQLKYLKNIFLNISEDFIRCILSKVVFPSMDNYADLIISSEDQNSNDDYCNDQEKENVHPNYCSKNTKKPLKLTSTVFSLSEISSVNDANQNSFSSKSQYDSKEFLNSFNISRQNFTIDLDYIRQGMENRTTIMIRNIPNRYSQESLLRVIDVKFKGMYDFIYLPMDFKVLLFLFIQY